MSSLLFFLIKFLSFSNISLYTTSQSRAADFTQDVTVSSSGNQHVISTGTAQFTIVQTLPALISSIQVGSDSLLAGSSSGSGPSITFIPQQSQFGTAARTLDANDASVTYFEITESTPVKATVLAEGVWSEGGGASLCDTFNSYYAQPYESFTFSLSLTFFRGRSDFKVQFHVRNQCSNGDGSDWTDQSFLINKASYALDFSQEISESSSSTQYSGGFSDSFVSNGIPSGSSVTTTVEQMRGSGSPWQRRARITNGSTATESEYINAPIVAITNGRYLVGTTLAYMRYREPQALRAQGSTLSMDVVSEQQSVGEGKGLWNQGMFVIRSVTGSIFSQNWQTELQSLRWPTIFEVGENERNETLLCSDQYHIPNTDKLITVPF